MHIPFLRWKQTKHTFRCNFPARRRDLQIRWQLARSSQCMPWLRTSSFSNQFVVDTVKEDTLAPSLVPLNVDPMWNTGVPNGIAPDVLYALSCSYGLPPSLRRGLTPSQVLMTLCMWTNTKTSPCPSALQVAKAGGAGKTAVVELLKPLQSVEVATGKTLCETERLSSEASE